MIYFIEAMVYPTDSDNRYFNLYKIGVTNFPQTRLKRLQYMSPVRLVLRGTMPGGHDVEAQLHARFASSHSHGEWFRGDEDIVDFIMANCTWLNHELIDRVR